MRLKVSASTDRFTNLPWPEGIPLPPAGSCVVMMHDGQEVSFVVDRCEFDLTDPFERGRHRLRSRPPLHPGISVMTKTPAFALCITCAILVAGCGESKQTAHVPPPPTTGAPEPGSASVRSPAVTAATAAATAPGARISSRRPIPRPVIPATRSVIPTPNRFYS